MRLALAGCSTRLAQRLRSALGGHELLEADPGDLEPAAAWDVILVASGRSTSPDLATCAERVRALRRRHPSLPILAFPDGARAHTVIDVLDAGADAVVTRPVDGDELRLRLRGLVRRAVGRDAHVLRYAHLRLSRLRHSAQGPAGSAALTPREHQILQYLMLNPERVVRRDEIRDAVWGSEGAPSANVLDVHLSHLRTKLAGVGAGDLVHTLRAVGLFFGAVEDDWNDPGGSPVGASRTGCTPRAADRM